MYYTTRADNPLKKMQSLIVIACKLLRIIYTILKNGTVYDPKKMLMDIRRQKRRKRLQRKTVDSIIYSRALPGSG